MSPFSKYRVIGAMIWLFCLPSFTYGSDQVDYCVRFPVDVPCDVVAQDQYSQTAIVRVDEDVPFEMRDYPFEKVEMLNFYFISMKRPAIKQKVLFDGHYFKREGEISRGPGDNTNSAGRPGALAFSSTTSIHQIKNVVITTIFNDARQVFYKLKYSERNGDITIKEDPQFEEKTAIIDSCGNVVSDSYDLNLWSREACSSR